jgi:3-deoxy-7-phosphoheptulonate synthase
MTQLVAPAEMISELPVPSEVSELVQKTRNKVRQIMHGYNNGGLVIIVGPCSVHERSVALEYARWLCKTRDSLPSSFALIMRAYVEKPRTSVGWKGLVYDPFLNNSFCVSEGLRLARSLLLEINSMGIPTATEFLSPTTEKYISDLISWGSIGSRTVTSQLHRELASGVECPIGFKNGINGDIKVGVDAILCARQPHHYLSINEWGMASVLRSKGNHDCHLVLRGGEQPNYTEDSVRSAARLLAPYDLPARVMIDCSHANCSKNYGDQVLVAKDIVRQLDAGSEHILGAMIESNLVSGRQDVSPYRSLVFGQSITDACVGLEDTARTLDLFANSMARRTKARTADLSAGVESPASLSLEANRTNCAT